MKRLVQTSLALAVFVSGCAKHPSDVPAARVDMIHYQSMDCATLTAKLSTTERRLADLTSTQTEAWVVDIIYPPGAFIGSPEADLAKAKGERLALREKIHEKKCGAPNYEWHGQ